MAASRTMTNKTSPSDGWPRTLTADMAASYLGCRSAAQFRREVKAGLWPPPKFGNSRPQRWSIEQLDGVLKTPKGEEHDPHLSQIESILGIANDEEGPPSKFRHKQGRRA